MIDGYVAGFTKTTRLQLLYDADRKGKALSHGAPFCPCPRFRPCHHLTLAPAFALTFTSPLVARWPHPPYPHPRPHSHLRPALILTLSRLRSPWAHAPQVVFLHRRRAAAVMIARKAGAKPTALDAPTLRTIEAVVQHAQGSVALARSDPCGRPATHRSRGPPARPRLPSGPERRAPAAWMSRRGGGLVRCGGSSPKPTAPYTHRHALYRSRLSSSTRRRRQRPLRHLPRWRPRP